jgi:GNAT superfamily N-acetyltransferase
MDGEVGGWLRLEEERGLSKLYQGRLYRGLPCFSGERTGGVAVACLLVLPELRRKGVARALVQAAVQDCLARGNSFLEAFPRGRCDVSDEEQWMGPLDLYLELGFDVVHDFGPYPVLRRTLAKKPAGAFQR